MLRLILLFTSLVFAFETSFGATFTYRALVPGERASGMGGAYIGLSNSAEAGYYNPAGLAFLPFDSVSVSGNFYTFTDGKRKDAVVFAGSSEDLPQESFTSIPQIANFAKRFNFPWEKTEKDEYKNAAALNVIVKDQADITGRVNFTNSTGQAIGNRSITDLSLLVGPSYARKITPRFSIGATLFYALRIQEGTAFLLNDSSSEFIQAYLSNESTVGNLVGIIGARYALMDDFWVGFVYQPQSTRLHGSGSRLLSAAVTDRNTDDLEVALEDDQNLSPRDETPHKIGMGLAWAKTRKYAIATDVLFHFENTYNSLADGSGVIIDQNFTVNFSVGGEYFLSRLFALRAGVYSDFSSAPNIQAGIAGQADQVDTFGWTLAGALEAENTSVSLGTMIRIGNGDGVDNVGNKISVENHSYSLLLAGSYRF